MAMARANVARRQGDDFQARLFWLKAACLLDPKCPVVKVTYEAGPRGFDDIVVEYDPRKAPVDHEGQPILRRYIQCKWHTTAGTFGYEDLIDPSFINADRYSLLQKVHTAQQSHALHGDGCRFELVTNWRLRADDPLIELVRKETDAIDLAQLFDGTTDRSRMGQVRKCWRDHLDIDDDALKKVMQVLAVAETPDSLMSLRERLDERFAAVGMKRVPDDQSCFFYDDLIAKLLAQGRCVFDRNSFHAMCRGEGILEQPSVRDNAFTIGIRSFMHPIDNLEDRCERMLNLVPYYDGRYIRQDSDWQTRIFPELRAFLMEAARSTDHLRLVVDSHVSIAFAVGTVLNVKAGKRVEIEQRTGGRRFWSMDDEPVDASWPRFRFEGERVSEGGEEIAFAVSLTHDVSPAVRTFAQRNLGKIGHIVHCRPESGPSQQSVRCGHHAWMLAESTVQHLLDLRACSHRVTRVHVFMAGPNSFAFFIGQQQKAIGPVATYEYDFDGQRGGGYSLGLSFSE